MVFRHDMHTRTLSSAVQYLALYSWSATVSVFVSKFLELSQMYSKIYLLAAAASTTELSLSLLLILIIVAA